MTTFSTPAPPRLDIEIGFGSVRIAADERDTTDVDVRPSRDDDECRRLAAATVVEQRGGNIVVRVPKRGLIGRTSAVDIAIAAPHASALRIATGSADVVATGRYGATDIGTGSADVTVDHIIASARVRSGSGDVRVGDVDGDVEVRTGSGDVRIDSVGGSMAAKTGSGNIELGNGGRALSALSGSGDVAVDDAPEEVGVRTASGDVRLTRVRCGSVSVTTASGEAHAGVAAGTSAWLDVATTSGRVRNDLASADEPGDGDDRVRLALRTVSGDISIARASESR